MVALSGRLSGVVLVGFLSLFLLITGCVSSENGANGTAKIEGSTQTVKGRVQQISVVDGTLIVAPPKGDRVSLKFTPQTPVKGGELKAVTKSQPVQVIYTVKGSENNATSIEILPQGSCGGS